MIKRVFTKRAVLAACLMLASCGGGESNDADSSTGSSVADLDVSGSKAAAYAIVVLNTPEGASLAGRPSETMGIYASSFLAQGSFLRSTSAVTGIDAQQKLISGQIQLETGETFALLKEFGAILQTNLIDALNRSQNRAEALDTYLSSLKNITELVQRKVTELESLEDRLVDERRDKKRELRDLERNVTQAIRNENYEQAGIEQEAATKLKTEVATLEAEIEQIDDILDRYDRLVEIAVERYDAIAANRRILIAGLKVVEVPGIENFDILDEDTPYGRGQNPFNVGVDPLNRSDD